MYFYRYLFPIFLGMIFNGHAQNLLEKENIVPANAADAEKIYVQLSGNTYSTIETIWFKAIVVNAFNNTPTTKSGILHVELIDPLDQRIVDSKLLKIDSGIADSFFQLHSNYREGKYIIRAYTEWNKNFGPDFIFSTPINIYQFQLQENKPNPIRNVVFTKDLSENKFTISSKVFPLELDSLHKGKSMVYLNWEGGTDSIEVKHKKKLGTLIEYNVPLDAQIINYQLKTQNKKFTKSVVLDEEYGSLSFFPEGGSLVNGLESNVGFKYLDYRGKGSKIKGILVDEEENKIISFESNALGMGKVALQPKAGKTYYGVLRTKNGNTFKYVLPKAKTEGTVLNISNTKSYRNLFFRAKSKKPDSVFVKVFHKGKDILFLKSKLKRGRFAYRIMNEQLPHGVIRVTVYDKNYKPINERHFFNSVPNENLEVSIKTDEQEYQLRDSVVVSIDTQRDNTPIPASVSIMAIDSAYFSETNVSRSSIISYFLLESDIRGEIENPFYYFENDKHLSDLDNLMLTQGWSNYKYDGPKKAKYVQAEKGLELTGTVGGVQRVKKRKKLKNNTYTINMVSFSDPVQAYTQEIDSTGHFRFALNESYGNGMKFVIQPADLHNKSDFFKVNIKRRNIPEIAYELDKVIVPVDSVIEKRVNRKIRDNVRLDPFLLPNTIALNEVVVSDYELTPKRAEMAEIHGLPDVVIDNNELIKNKKNWTGNLYSWLLFNYPEELEIVRVGPGGGFQIARVHGAGFTYVLIDGIPVDIDNYSLIGDIPLEGVKSAEILRTAPSANRYCSEVFNYPCITLPAFPAILSLYTYSGKGLFGAFPQKTSLIKDTAPQYSPKREFYVPEYTNPSKIDWSVPDLRTLLHWQPNISTNTDGTANITFFNGDTTGKMIVICEGITADGSVGYSEITYEIVE